MCESINDEQLQKIVEYRTKMQNLFKRNMSISEAIICWIAKANSEDPLNNHYWNQAQTESYAFFYSKRRRYNRDTGREL